ncbi:helix-turn-helix domain-containing protein [Pseudoalteromonas sp. T1lg22]|uniref:helix-turn-helix domain-containing protein n=1 Tax=Pseudoalteromonas sp. T1lg22 TaxID=2077096 RepID=UPI000CF5F086|nr:helix-turn-helix domain-containing protein [Pseudoalteromonas sp. T1lg22]
MELIPPEQLKALREKLGLSTQQAADSVYIARRLWQRYEASKSAESALDINAPKLELFCLKHGLPYPPNKRGTLGKIVSFYGGLGGYGHTLLTIDICTLLIQEGFDVLIVTGRHGASIFEQHAADENLPFPRVKVVEEYPSSGGEGVFAFLERFQQGPDDINTIAQNYDFVFIDLNFDAAERYFEKIDPDLIITPIKLSDVHQGVMRAFKNVLEIKEQLLKRGNSKTQVAALMLSVSTHYTFSPQYYGLIDDSEADYEEKAGYFAKEREQQRNEQQEFIALFNELHKADITLMDNYTSNAYESYYGHSEKGYSIIHQAPNSLPAHEIRGVKNEMMRMLGVPTRKKSG